VINAAPNITLHVTTASFSNIFPPCQPRHSCTLRTSLPTKLLHWPKISCLLPSLGLAFQASAVPLRHRIAMPRKSLQLNEFSSLVSRDPINPKGLCLSTRLRRDQVDQVSRPRRVFITTQPSWSIQRYRALHRQPIVNFPMNGLRQATQLECSWIALSPNICTYAARGAVSLSQICETPN
jgi:hypothetical protein